MKNKPRKVKTIYDFIGKLPKLDISIEEMREKAISDAACSLKKYGKNAKPGTSMEKMKKEAWEEAVQEKYGKKTSKRISFPDLETFFQHFSPKRMQLIKELHSIGSVDINSLSKHLHRHHKNVSQDLEMLEAAGLVVKTDDGQYRVPWNEFIVTVKV